jgi:hypothetical protein
MTTTRKIKKRMQSRVEKNAAIGFPQLFEQASKQVTRGRIIPCPPARTIYADGGEELHGEEQGRVQIQLTGCPWLKHKGKRYISTDKHKYK